jgi:hypothetical protein
VHKLTSHIFPFADPPVIVSLVSILNAISFLGLVMYTTLVQALLGPIIIMFMTAATALMCITTMETVLSSFFDSEYDIRYGRINTQSDTQRRSYSGPVRASPEWSSDATFGTARTRLNALCKTE